MKDNHDRPLSDFKKSIDILKSNGFKPIAVTQMFFEDVFVFQTKKEASRAYKQFEKKEKNVVGWWYGKEDFLKAVKKYEEENNGYSKVKIFWL